jgi:thymidylate synthase ThyX
MIYPLEPLSDSERQRLQPHVTSIQGPVFALTNLPETVKAAMFARYSRYPGTLRRLFLDEFADTLPPAGNVDAHEGARAAEIMSRVFINFGDDSVAQLGGVHLACEWSSNLLTKILQRGRIANYLEQSTRYIAFDKPVAALDGADGEWAGRYRYYRHDELGPEYVTAMNTLFETYAELLPRLQEWLHTKFKADPGQEAAHARAIRAKALDCLRGLLPASSLSHMGIWASGQAYEQLVMHLLAHPLAEAREYGQLMLPELQKVIPSFLGRVERPERGGRWIKYLKERGQAEQRQAARVRGDVSSPQRPSVELISYDGTVDEMLAALVFERSGQPESATLAAVAELTDADRSEMLRDLIGERENRRHRPGRGLERIRYRFEIVSDYGAFRDLQRHRMLTAQWQQLTPDLGADVPPEIDDAGLGDQFRRALDVSSREHARLRSTVGADAAQMALCLAYRMRYILDMNAREALHLIELRSGREGHPAYRAVALEMHRQIAEVHPQVAAVMSHVDSSTDARLERIQSEIRAEDRRRAADL